MNSKKGNFRLKKRTPYRIVAATSLFATLISCQPAPVTPTTSKTTAANLFTPSAIALKNGRAVIHTKELLKQASSFSNKNRKLNDSCSWDSIASRADYTDIEGQGAGWGATIPTDSTCIGETSTTFGDGIMRIYAIVLGNGRGAYYVAFDSETTVGLELYDFYNVMHVLTETKGVFYAGTFAIVGDAPTPEPTNMPEFTVSIDDIEDDYPVINTVIPKFKVKLLGSDSEINGVDDVKFTFSQRSDGITPLLNRSTEYLSISNNKKNITYKTPFEENTILYTGDQYVDVSVTNKLGHTREKRFQFAIGQRTLYSGFPPTTNAYRLKTTPEVETDEPKKVQNLRIKGITIIKAFDQNFSSGSYNNSNRPKANKIVYLARIGAKIALFYYDGSYDSVTSFITRGYNEIDVNIGKIKTIFVPAHLQQHSDADETDFVHTMSANDAAAGLRKDARDEGNSELWINHENDGAVEGLIIFKGTEYRLYVPTPETCLYHFKISEMDESGVYTIVEAYKPGIWDEARRNIWPAPEDVDFRTRQWSDTARLVMCYTPDYNSNLPRKRFDWNINPFYPTHLAGRIEDLGVKPYRIKEDVEIFRQGVRTITSRGAKHINGALIAGFEPSWTSIDKFNDSYDKHVEERNEFVNFTPFIDTSEAYRKAGADFIEGFVRDGSTFTRLQKIRAYTSSKTQQILMYYPTKHQLNGNQLSFLRIDNSRIISFFRPGTFADGTPSYDTPEEFVSKQIIKPDGYDEIVTK